MPMSWSHWLKTPQPNSYKVFFELWTTQRHKSLQGLNSSLAQFSAELWLVKICPERANYAFSEKFWNRPITGFLTYNFGRRSASKSIKGSIDADFDLVFKFSTKLWAKRVGQWVVAQGRPNAAKISKTCLLCDVTSRNPATENEKRLFSILTTRLAESVDGLDSSLAQSPGEL